MSSHLRHCPKHKKSLPCGHCVLAMKPAQTPPVVSIGSKPGPKPKFGIAMTVAERQRASRQRKKNAAEEAERKQIIRRLMEIFDDRKSFVRRDLPGSSERQTQDTIRRREYLRELILLSLEQLELALGNLGIGVPPGKRRRQNPDRVGELPGERSGEGKRKQGMSEVERIANQRDIQEQAEGNFELAGARKVKPAGTAPDGEESRGGKTSSLGKGYVPLSAYEAWVNKTFERIAEESQIEEAFVCPVCQRETLTRDGMAVHLEVQFYAGEQQVKKWRDHDGAIRQMNELLESNGRVPIDLPGPPQSLEIGHFVFIRDEAMKTKRMYRKRRFGDETVKAKQFVTSGQKLSRAA